MQWQGMGTMSGFDVCHTVSSSIDLAKVTPGFKLFSSN